MHSVHFTSSTNGWAVGGEVIHWDGNEWSIVWSPPPSFELYLHCVHFPVEEEGWAVGYGIEDTPDSLKILHFYDNQWHTTPGLHFIIPCSVYFISKDEGWAVGDLGLILRYSTTGAEEKNAKYRMLDVKSKITTNLSQSLVLKKSIFNIYSLKEVV